MTKLIEVIKQVALNVYTNSMPTIVRYGTVESISPLKIRLSQKEIFGASYFVIKQGGGNFEVGDELILLRIHEGQRYLIFGKKGVL